MKKFSVILLVGEKTNQGLEIASSAKGRLAMTT